MRKQRALARARLSCDDYWHSTAQSSFIESVQDRRSLDINPASGRGERFMSLALLSEEARITVVWNEHGR
jgi:hypothetical protein